MTPRIEPPQCGYYPNIPDEKYRSWKALSCSDLKMVARSPLHYQYGLMNPREDTAALAFGRAYHCYLLERDSFDQRSFAVRSTDCHDCCSSSFSSASD